MPHAGPDLRSAAFLAETAAAAVAARDAELRDEHSPVGVDALAEPDLLGLLADAFARAGFGVRRDEPYPAAAEGRKKAGRQRCDLLLVPAPAETDGDGPGFGAAFGAGDAFWLEVRPVHQVRYVSGEPRANARYERDLVDRAADDLVKIALDPAIEAGGLLVLLFCAGEDVARHDLAAAGHAMLNRSAPLASPSIAATTIDDRVGNACCAAALFPARL